LVGFIIIVGTTTLGQRASSAGASSFFDVRLGGGVAGLLQAAALCFVAYTGYGRIATLGEEVRDPQRTIPRAIVTTVFVTAALYIAVAAVGVFSVGADAFYQATTAHAAPLTIIARQVVGDSAIAHATVGLITLGAITAMLGVLLNLLLGLSRVVLAMARRGDLPGQLAQLNDARTTPRAAVLVTALFIAALVCIGRVELTWSFSALTVLIYYGLTNLAALRLPREAQRYPRGFAWAGLIGCVGLAAFIEPVYWLIGGGLIALGLAWHRFARNRDAKRRR
jgi:APA family basic amino acid/polyamine antiporter